MSWAFLRKFRRRSTLPQSLPCSTIDPGGLNFRVRDGNGCGPSGVTAGNQSSFRAESFAIAKGRIPTRPILSKREFRDSLSQWCFELPTLTSTPQARTFVLGRRGERSRVPHAFASPASSAGAKEIKVVKPHDRLVLVSSAPYSASTPSLSTTWSMWGLQETEVSGMPYLEVGFPLRCFQRLSLPNIATRHCGWRHNRHTSGPSIPVLSY